MIIDMVIAKADDDRGPHPPLECSLCLSLLLCLLSLILPPPSHFHTPTLAHFYTRTHALSLNLAFAHSLP